MDHDPLRGLLPQHGTLLQQSAISDDVARQRGYRSITKKADLAKVGFSRGQTLVPTLLIPVHDVFGSASTYQHRPDNPRTDRKGKPIKYETVAKSRMVIDVHPQIRSQLGDPKIPLWITEGVRKGDAAVSAGLCCIALLGVWNWRGTNAHGGKTALPDWEQIALNGRLIYLAFDSDAMKNPHVYDALERLKGFLDRRGGEVHIIYFPSELL